MKAASARTASWSAVAAGTLLLAGIGLVVGRHIDSAVENATLLARPHEVQTALQYIGAGIDALDDSVQDYIIEGTEGARIRFQYEDAARSLRARTADLGGVGQPRDIERRAVRNRSPRRGRPERQQSGDRCRQYESRGNASTPGRRGPGHQCRKSQGRGVDRGAAAAASNT